MKKLSYLPMQYDENIRYIEDNIKSEERRVKRLKDKMVDIKFDLMATRKALAFWKGKLRELKKHTKEAK